MSLLRESRDVRKVKAIRRAEFGLKQRLERIDWEEDVLLPEVEAILAGRPVMGLEAGAAFDVVIEEPHAALTAAPSNGDPGRDSDSPDADPRDEPSAAGA